MPATVGGMVGGIINRGAGVSVGYAVRRPVERLPGVLASGPLACSTLVFALAL